jgi:hypothetical protein
VYWLDYKISKRVIPLSKVYEDRYIDYLSSFSGIKITKNRESLIRKAVKCFFYNLTFYVGIGSKEIVVSLDK